MHIPDGFLSLPVWALMYALSILLLVYLFGKRKEEDVEKRLPMLGVVAAFVFAAQMLNMPIGGGTSGHFLGGVFSGVLLGPLGGSVAMACVLVLQALLFQDGGITALGANLFNMGVIGTVFGYYAFHYLSGLVRSRKWAYASLFIAAWMSVLLASVAAAIEIAASGAIEMGIVLPAMVLVHIPIGALEGVITILAVSAIAKARPDLLPGVLK